MSFTAFVYEILIAGPSDVTDHRTVTEDLMNEWTRHNSRERGIVLSPVRWETHTVPRLGKEAQALIFDQLDDRCDALIAIFGDKLGTKTQTALSGTVEEVQKFAVGEKYVACYFSGSQVERNRDALRQASRVEKFKGDLRKQGLTGEYTSEDSFAQEIRKLLPVLAREAEKLRDSVQRAKASNDAGDLPAFVVSNSLNEQDIAVLMGACRVAEHEESRRLDADQLSSDPELQDFRRDALWDSVMVLGEEGYFTVDDWGRESFQVKHHVLDNWFEASRRSYDQDIQAVIDAIVLGGLVKSEPVCERTGLSTFLVDHIFERLELLGLLRHQRYMGGSSKVYALSASLKRLASKTEAEPSSRPVSSDPRLLQAYKAIEGLLNAARASKEKSVFENQTHAFHEALALAAEASGENLDLFRVPESELHYWNPEKPTTPRFILMDAYRGKLEGALGYLADRHFK